MRAVYERGWTSDKPRRLWAESRTAGKPVSGQELSGGQSIVCLPSPGGLLANDETAGGEVWRATT